MADLAHAAHAAVSVKPILTQGITMIALLISNVATAAVSVGISWYISHRGMAGVKIDLDNAKKEIQKLLGNAAPAV